MMTSSAWQQHRTDVYRYLLRRLRHTEQAEDLTQETFLRFHRAKPLLAQAVQVRAWLFRTAHNLIKDGYRAKRNEVPLDEVSLVAEPDRGASLRVLEPCIGVLAGRLPEDYRVALLWDLEGVPQQEIARRQEVGLSGAKSRVQRARALLQKEFERCCQYHFAPDGTLLSFSPRGCNCG